MQQLLLFTDRKRSRRSVVRNEFQTVRSEQADSFVLQILPDRHSRQATRKPLPESGSETGTGPVDRAEVRAKKRQ